MFAARHPLGVHQHVIERLAEGAPRFTPQSVPAGGGEWSSVSCRWSPSGACGPIAVVQAVVTGEYKTEGGWLAVAAFVVIGGSLMACPFIVLSGRTAALRSARVLVFEPDGIRFHDSGGVAFAVRWSELAGFSVVKVIVVRRGRLGYTLVFVVLELVPAASTFGQHHPGLVPQEGGTDQYTVAASRLLALRLARASKRFAPGIFHGVVTRPGMLTPAGPS